MIYLSARLQTIASLVEPGAAVIDVGTDHGRIPVWLAQSGVAARVLATDIRPGPLAGAAALAEKTGMGERVTLRLTDGLAGICPDGWDTVIIAGMGGETIASILAAAPWTRNGVRLILSPHSKRAVLRRFLTENGYRILSERLTEDAGRIYPILTAEGGSSGSYTPAELQLGKLEQIAGDGLFGPYLDGCIARAEKAAPYSGEASALAAEYRQIKRRLFPYDDSK